MVRFIDQHKNKINQKKLNCEEPDCTMTHTLQVFPTKPKRARSAYNYFFHDERKRLQEMHQGENNGRKASYAAISKLVAARWKLISSQDKLHYESLAAKDKYRFGLEMIQWKTHQLEVAKDQSKASRSFPEGQSEPRRTPNSTAKREETQFLPDLPREQNFMDRVSSYVASHTVLSESYDVSEETSLSLPFYTFVDELTHTPANRDTEIRGRSGSSTKCRSQVSFDQKQYRGFHSTDGFYHTDVFDAMDNMDGLPDYFDITTVFD